MNARAQLANEPTHFSPEGDLSMLHCLSAMGLALMLTPALAWIAADEQVTLIIPGIK